MTSPHTRTATLLRDELRKRREPITVAVAVALAVTPGLLPEFLAQIRENRLPTESAISTPKTQ